MRVFAGDGFSRSGLWKGSKGALQGFQKGFIVLTRRAESLQRPLQLKQRGGSLNPKRV